MWPSNSNIKTGPELTQTPHPTQALPNNLQSVEKSVRLYFLHVKSSAQGITKYQGHVNNPNRIAEIASRAFDISMSERGPAQINIPRDYFYHEGKNLKDLIPQDEDEVRLNFKTGFSLSSTRSFSQKWTIYSTLTAPLSTRNLPDPST